MKDNRKYNEYVVMCNEANEVPFEQHDRRWSAHKGKLVEAKPKPVADQSAADDYIDYLNDRY